MEFKGENIIEFSARFKDDISCLEYLAEIKWGQGYVCPKCGNTKSIMLPNLEQ
jgi:hypothetical protein